MIKLFIMDVDGTLTDGSIYISPDGECMKAFNVKDGHGIKKLKKYGIIPIIITGRNSQIAVRRANELGIDGLFQGIDDKRAKVHELAKEYGCKYDSLSGKYIDIAYIGDDENDIGAMQVCGCAGCPEDAVETVKSEVDFIADKQGGKGAVREFIEYILQHAIG